MSEEETCSKRGSPGTKIVSSSVRCRFIRAIGSADLRAVVHEQSAGHVVDDDVRGLIGARIGSQGSLDELDALNDRIMTGLGRVVHHSDDNLVEQRGGPDGDVDVSDGDRVIGARADDLHTHPFHRGLVTLSD